MSGGGRNLDKEVQFGFLPVKKSEREFGLWDFLFVTVGFGIAAWCFLVGGLTGLTLKANDAIAVILFGNAFPVFLIIPIAVYFSRYGLDTFVGFRSALGYYGSDLFFIIFSILNLGWIAVACFMMGEASIKVASVLGLSDFWTARETGAPFFGLAAFTIGFLVAFMGPGAIKWFTRIGVPAVFLVLIGLILAVFFKHGINNVFSAQPIKPYDNMARSIATAIEWNVGLGFSWLPYIGQWSRLTKNEKTAYVGSFWGWGVLLNIAAIFGAFTALVVGSGEPTDWMIAVGGTTWGLVGLLLLIVGNTTSAVILIYSQAISFKTLFPKPHWLIAVCTTLPSIILITNPKFYDAYGSFLSVIAYVMAAYGGIVIADYFLVKKGDISVRELYNRSGIYRYWKGFNPASLVALVASSVTFWSLYNPLTDEASQLFNYISAGLPTYFVAAIVYFVTSTYIFPYRINRTQKVAREDEMGVT